MGNITVACMLVKQVVATWLVKHKKKEFYSLPLRRA